MKSLSIALAAACCALATSDVCSASSLPQAHLQFHQHSHHHKQQQQHTSQVKHVFHVQARKSLFDHALQHVREENGVALDVWSVRAAADSANEKDPMLDAKVYATPASMKAFQRSSSVSSVRTTSTKIQSSDDSASTTARSTGHVKIHISKYKKHAKDMTIDNLDAEDSDWTTEYEEIDRLEKARITKDREEVAACLNRTVGFLDELKTKTMEKGDSYTKSVFFDCFRPHDQVFAFLDVLTEQNSAIMAKLSNISHTYEGRAIPAYRLSTTKSSGRTETPKKALYVQALIHAREWQAGSSTFFTIAKLVDELRKGSKHIKAVFDEFDWYFVPIVNIDGYIYSATVDRYWRTSRDLVDKNGSYVPGVDLNRNFGPDEYFNVKPELVDDETNPGAHPLSEPSTAGIFRFLKDMENLSGIVDMHTFGGDVLRPFSNHPGEAPAPFGPQLKKLGDGVAEAMSTHTKTPYNSKTGAYLYEAYGCFDDGMYLEFNYTVPAITVEVEGEDFIVPQSTIRPVGKHIYHGLLRFAQEASSYREMVDNLKTVADAAAADDESEDAEDESEYDDGSEYDSASGSGEGTESGSE